MNKIKIAKGGSALAKGVIAVILLAITNLSAVAQSADTLSIDQAIKEAVDTHPTVLQATEALKAADARIALSKSNYLPTVDGVATVSHIGPVPSIDFGGKSFKMAPDNSYNAGVNVNQLIYDFGKTKNGISAEMQSKNLAAITIEQAKQRIASSVVGTYLSLVYLQKSKDIKDEQLRTLRSHLDFVSKKKATGSATEYEILTTKVRISNIESQRSDIITSLGVQQAVLNTLLGREVGSPIAVSKSIPANQANVASDSLAQYAFANRNELKAASEKATIEEMKYKLAKLQKNPSLSFFANGGVKNGYVPYLNDPKLNYVVGLSFRIPIFDGNRTANNATIAHTAVVSSGYETEAIRRSVSVEVAEANLGVDAARSKIIQFEMQQQQAQKALHLAEESYKAGAITNLDLLDATTSLSESQLYLIKARIDYCNSLYKLKVALGERLY
ncbi:TolC family protein [Acetobacteroides hydrogenigenes]|uniref:Outer membrane protein TolC n=1 Tax=Acetobacteroides hydrogenigenes TaxID=979970 RepID=A0A4R2F1S1_9BACT|nr:TolC family protein [Acetobacteroides hydrogenigenes]TCN73305.1 outer membrane protein TolC [Acetobacteroides hydrogenigenes]